jgi:hypothetical protein
MSLKRNTRVLMKFRGSSALKDAWYNLEKEELTVRFHSGLKYCYHEVPAGTALTLAAAPSAGRYFQDFIGGRFNFTVKPTGLQPKSDSPAYNASKYKVVSQTRQVAPQELDDEIPF